MITISQRPAVRWKTLTELGPEIGDVVELKRRIEALENALRVRGCSESYIKEIQEAEIEHST